MIVLAFAMTVAALAVTAFVLFGNMMNPTGIGFVGMPWIALAWIGVLVFWLAWWFK